jgi:hypothetical protein
MQHTTCFTFLSFWVIRVNVEGQYRLRELFFGGAGARIMPSSVTMARPQNSSVSVFQDANNNNNRCPAICLADCNHMLRKAEETVADRFQLNPRRGPAYETFGASNGYVYRRGMCIPTYLFLHHLDACLQSTHLITPTYCTYLCMYPYHTYRFLQNAQSWATCWSEALKICC